MNVNTLYRIHQDDTDDILKIEEIREEEWRIKRPPPILYESTPRHNAARRRDTNYKSRKARRPE